MNVRLLILGLLLIFICKALRLEAQQELRLSHGQLADMLRNPAIIGEKSSLSAFVLHRRQWMDLAGAPVTTFIGGAYQLKSEFGGALGLQLVDDRIGEVTMQNLKFNYSKEFRFGVAALRVGVGVNVAFLKERTDMWRTSDVVPDQALVNNQPSANFIDGQFGLTYQRNDLRVGGAVTRLRELSLNDLYWVNRRSYNGFLSYRIQWGEKIAYNTVPSVRLRYDAISNPQLEGRFDTDVNNKYLLQLGYRHNESILAGAGLILPVGGGKMTLSYVFDYSLNALAEFQSGSHEMMISFNLDRVEVKEKKEIKNVRFL